MKIMNDVIKIILGSTFCTTIFSGLITYYFHNRTELFNAKLKREYEERAQVQITDFEWKKETLKVLGQVYIHLNRTRVAFLNTYSKLKEYDGYYEDEILYKSNTYIRDLLIENSHQIPPDLLDDATKLIEHYDNWISKYHKIRIKNKDFERVHIYVVENSDGVGFPPESEARFQKNYINLFFEMKQSYPAMPHK